MALSKAAQEIGNYLQKKFQGDFSGKTYIAFDISSSGTGWSIWRLKKNRTGRYVKGGVICPKGETAKDRFPEMANGILSIISEENPDFIISEQMFFRKSFDSIEYPLKLHGIEEYAASIANIPDLPIVTSTWRSVCGFENNLTLGKKKNMTGKEKDAYYKTSSIRLSSDVTQKEIIDDNHADSICIGYATSLIIKNIVQYAQKNEKNSKRKSKNAEILKKKVKK